MGGVASTIGKGLGAIGTGGLSLIPGNNIFSRTGNDIGSVLTGGTSGQSITNPINGNPISVFGGPGNTNPSVPGPFSLDPNQTAADTSAITGLGKSQYQQTMNQVPTDVANAIQQENPQIMEQLNSGGLLNSSAYPQEIARQQSYLTQNLALPAMQSLQGTQTAGLQRGLSMEDFINQANVAKTIGAQMAPQPPSSKAQAGTAMQGVGAIAPWFAKGGALGK